MKSAGAGLRGRKININARPSPKPAGADDFDETGLDRALVQAMQECRASLANLARLELVFADLTQSTTQFAEMLEEAIREVDAHLTAIDDVISRGID